MIPEKVTNAVAYLVSKGEFAGEAEAYEAFLKAWQEYKFRMTELEIINEGLQGGPSLDGPTVMAELLAKYSVDAATS